MVLSLRRLHFEVSGLNDHTTQVYDWESSLVIFPTHPPPESSVYIGYWTATFLVFLLSLPVPLPRRCESLEDLATQLHLRAGIVVRVLDWREPNLCLGCDALGLALHWSCPERELLKEAKEEESRLPLQQSCKQWRPGLLSCSTWGASWEQVNVIFASMSFVLWAVVPLCSQCAQMCVAVVKLTADSVLVWAAHSPQCLSFTLAGSSLHLT